MGDFEKTLPHETRIRSLHSGQELVLSFDNAQKAVVNATHHSIAVLGVEVFRIRGDGLAVETYSGYVCELDAWHDFVKCNNHEASNFLLLEWRGGSHGYILTAVSENEFRAIG